MQCDKCRNEAVLFQQYSGRYLCGRHLAEDIEIRAKRSIRAHHWLSPGDHIAVMISGDKKGGALLYFLKKLTAGRRDIRLSVLSAGKETPGKGGQPAAVKIAQSLRVPNIELPLTGGSGSSAQDSVTKVALGISLDDVAEGVLGRFLFGNVNQFIHPTPSSDSRITVICPFFTIPSEELDLYWDCQGTGIDLIHGTPPSNDRQKDANEFLNKYSRRHPATKFALLHLGEQLSNGAVAVLPVTGEGSADTHGDTCGTSRFLSGVTDHGA